MINLEKYLITEYAQEGLLSRLKNKYNNYMKKMKEDEDAARKKYWDEKYKKYEKYEDYLFSLKSQICHKFNLQVDKSKEEISHSKLTTLSSVDFDTFRLLADDVFNQINRKRIETVNTIILEEREGTPNIMDTKYCGIPYSEGNFLSSDAKDHFLVIQVNFSQIPPSEELPANGIFQVWATDTDYADEIFTKFWKSPSMTKMNKSLLGDYYKKIENLAGDSYVFDSYNIKGVRLVGKSINEFNSEKIAQVVQLNLSDKYYNIKDIIKKYLLSAINNTIDTKLLGFDYPIQVSQRSFIGDTRLLLQIEPNGNELRFGDNGNLQVYINKNNLQKHDLEKSYIYTSCY